MEIMFNNSLLNKTEIINTNLDEKCWNQYVLITSFILFFLSEILPFIKKKKKYLTMMLLTLTTKNLIIMISNKIQLNQI
jgi:hypothetical protein